MEERKRKKSRKRCESIFLQTTIGESAKPFRKYNLERKTARKRGGCVDKQNFFAVS